MVSKGRHPKKPIADAISALDKSTFEVIRIHNTSHQWGVVKCKVCGTERSVWSTPGVPENHAYQIRRFAEKHTHRKE